MSRMIWGSGSLLSDSLMSLLVLYLMKFRILIVVSLKRSGGEVLSLFTHVIRVFEDFHSTGTNRLCRPGPWFSSAPASTSSVVSPISADREVQNVGVKDLTSF